MENKFYSGHWKSYLQYYNFIFVFAVPTPEQVNPPEGMVIFQDSIFEEKRMTLFLFIANIWVKLPIFPKIMTHRLSVVKFKIKIGRYF